MRSLTWNQSLSNQNQSYSRAMLYRAVAFSIAYLDVDMVPPRCLLRHRKRDVAYHDFVFFHHLRSSAERASPNLTCDMHMNPFLHLMLTIIARTIYIFTLSALQLCNIHVFKDCERKCWGKRQHIPVSGVPKGSVVNEN